MNPFAGILDKHLKPLGYRSNRQRRWTKSADGLAKQLYLFSSRWDKNIRYLDIRLNFDDSSAEDVLAARLDSWLPSGDILTLTLSLPGDENEQTFEALLQSEIIPLLDSLTVEFLASKRADDLLDWALMSPELEERLRPE